MVFEMNRLHMEDGGGAAQQHMEDGDDDGTTDRFSGGRWLLVPQSKRRSSRAEETKLKVCWNNKIKSLRLNFSTGKLKLVFAAEFCNFTQWEDGKQQKNDDFSRKIKILIVSAPTNDGYIDLIVRPMAH